MKIALYTDITVSYRKAIKRIRELTHDQRSRGSLVQLVIVSRTLCSNA